jgi:hypothetical protein
MIFSTIDSISEFCYVTKFLFFDKFTISMIPKTSVVTELNKIFD